MRILVVGSRGFIGSHCVDYFSKEHEVWGCDVVVDYNNPRYFWIGSIDGEFYGLFSANRFDVCINCSGAASVPFSLSNPYNDFSLNTVNVFKLLEAIRIHNSGCRFINMSSAAVYGNPSELPVNNSASLAPVSPYGYHKSFSESICEEYYRFWGVRTCCLRIFSAYGPGLKKQLFWDMYRKFRDDNSIILCGTGAESRDFIYVTDVVKTIDIVINNSEFRAEKINVANGNDVSINEVASTFIRILGVNKRVEFNGLIREGDPINWRADIKELKQWGYKPQVSLEEGIRRYIEWAEKQ